MENKTNELTQDVYNAVAQELGKTFSRLYTIDDIETKLSKMPPDLDSKAMITSELKEVENDKSTLSLTVSNLWEDVECDSIPNNTKIESAQEVLSHFLKKYSESSLSDKQNSLKSRLEELNKYDKESLKADFIVKSVQEDVMDRLLAHYDSSKKDSLNKVVTKTLGSPSSISRLGCTVLDYIIEKVPGERIELVKDVKENPEQITELDAILLPELCASCYVTNDRNFSVTGDHSAASIMLRQNGEDIIFGGNHKIIVPVYLDACGNDAQNRVFGKRGSYLSTEEVSRKMEPDYARISDFLKDRIIAGLEYSDKKLLEDKLIVLPSLHY